MRYIFLLFLLGFELFGGVVKGQIVAVKGEYAKVQIPKVEAGVSGFVVHYITPEHGSILKKCIVVGYDTTRKMAMVHMSDFTLLKTNSLPSGKWQVSVGDEVQLAVGYSRSVLITPSEEIYYQISKAVQTQWVHPDIFATLLSYKGHPTPMLEDFQSFGVAANVGLVFLYLDQKLYTVDIQSFVILHVDDAPLKQDSVRLPFYSRVEHIESGWFDWFSSASDEMEAYEPHYYKLLAEHNKHNKVLYEAVKNNKDPQVRTLRSLFEVE